MTTKHTLAAAAIAGLLTGTATKTQAASSSDNQAGAKVGMMAKDTNSCKGQNACKGKGGCKSSDNGCKGKNSCKGKGGCATDGSMH